MLVVVVLVLESLELELLLDDEFAEPPPRRRSVLFSGTPSRGPK